ncbi:hypothetical protein OROMI_004020 [Orobanche minor]
MWYSEITPDKEAPELIRAIVMDVLADVSGRVKEINLVELLTRDVVDLIGNHIDLCRRNQTMIVAGDGRSPVVDVHMRDHVLADFQEDSSGSHEHECISMQSRDIFKMDDARELSVVGSGTSHDDSIFLVNGLDPWRQQASTERMFLCLKILKTCGRKEEILKTRSRRIRVLESRRLMGGSLAHKPEISTKNKAKASAKTPSSHSPDFRLFSQMENAEHLSRETGKGCVF